MEDKLFTLLGLGVPFYLAAATYAVFSSSIRMVVFPIAVHLPIIVATDYLSLIFVRKFLNAARVRPLIASVSPRWSFTFGYLCSRYLH